MKNINKGYFNMQVIEERNEDKTYDSLSPSRLKSILHYRKKKYIKFSKIFPIT